LHNDELDDLYSSPNIIRVIKSRKMRGGILARNGEGRGVYRVFIGWPERKRALEDQSVDGWITLRWTLGR
jgi:hypothetical protein